MHRSITTDLIAEAIERAEQQLDGVGASYEDFDMKRRTNQQRKLKDRRSGPSPYAKYGKKPYKYPWERAKDHTTASVKRP